MAKKKSKQDENLQNTENVAEGSQTGISGQENTGEDVPNVTQTPTNPENPIEPVLDSDISKTVNCDVLTDPSLSVLHATGEVHIDADFVDNQVLSRLRSALLSPTEVYREAQLFAAQQLNVASLLNSGEAVLTLNTLEILRAMDLWYSESLAGTCSDDPRVQETASRYILHCLRRSLVDPADLVSLVIQLNATSACSCLTAFAEKLCTALLAMIELPESDVPVIQNALSRLCTVLPSASVSRLLYDPSSIVRIAVIRSLIVRSSIDINDLSVALILLKDRDEQVNIALMRLFSHFATCPELVVPPLLNLLPFASDELKNEILDVFRSYGSDAVDTVIQCLDTTQSTVYGAIRDLIALSPQRYTDALLKPVLSVRTREHVRERLIDILKSHRDPARRAEIDRVLANILPPACEERPEWVAPDTTPKYLAKAVDRTDIYEKVLDSAELADFAGECSDETLTRLLADASQTVLINAIHVILHRAACSDAHKGILCVWMKSASIELASAALDAYLTVEKDLDAAVATVIDAFAHGESDDVKKCFFTVLTRHQSTVDALIRAYYQAPRKCSGFIRKFLMLGPSQPTLKAILAGLNRDQSVACIAETLISLLHIKVIFDDRPIRPDLLRLVREPVSFGQYGFETRLLSLKLLRKYLTAPGQERDAASISSLQAFYKETKHAELKRYTKDLLKDLGEEIFDFDDEDDDFDDLNDEDDE